MRFSFALLAGSLLATGAVVACGIDDTFDGTVYEPGAGNDGGGTALGDSGRTTTPEGGITITPEGGPVEAGSPPPPAPCSIPPGACVGAIPAGWAIVTYQASQTTECAAPFTKTDVVSNPVAGATACGCGCTVTTSPACDQGTLARKKSDGADTTCDADGATLTVAGSGCLAFPTQTTLAKYSKMTAIGPSGGACSAAATMNVGAVTTTAGRVCTPPTSCEEQLCALDGGAPGGYAVCIAQTGAAASCPTGWGTTPVVVGSAPSLACSACTCDLGATTCTNAKVSFYSDATCTAGNLQTTENVDGNCNMSGDPGANPDGFKYSATVNAACNANGPKTATVSVNGPQTICCRP